MKKSFNFSRFGNYVNVTMAGRRLASTAAAAKRGGGAEGGLGSVLIMAIM